MHPMLNIGVRAARSAGNVICRAFEQLDLIEVEQKGANDFVSSVDRDAEQAIINTIRRSYPDHVIVGEESGQHEGSDSDYVWVIDPLDGTTNFINGFPHFAVSIALKVKGKLDQAIVYDPIRSELFTASRGGGAQLNGYRLRCGKRKDLNGALLATGFPFKYRQHLDAYLKIFSSFFEQASDVRRAGAAALDLAYVAAGRVDGFWEIGLKPWDFAAGELLIREAGGLVCDFNGGHEYGLSGNLVAGNPRVVKQMLTKMRPHIGTSLAR